MDKIRLAIVGCGGMGHRHLNGLAEYQRAGFDDFELVGACDPVTENAESLATQAAKYFDNRPTVTRNLSELTVIGIDAVDVTTSPRYHHPITIEALERGWHVMVEKPMGLTVRACNLMMQAADKTDRVLSVAENYRRDPVYRLAKALLQAGIIGDPRFLIQHSVGGGDQMLISVWRHQKNESGILLDVGVHHTDMMEYLLGDIVTVYAQTRLHERIRHNPAAGGGESRSNPAGVYGRWQKQMPAQFEATAEDAAYATLTFKSGAVGQYIEDHAGHGQHQWSRQIYGSQGSLILPGDRSGGKITLYTDAGVVIDDARLLDFAPNFYLEPVTAALFGGDRLWCYDFPFTQTDPKITAIEYGDFARAIRGEHPPEVDALQGTRAVAASYAVLESGVLGQPVTIDEVMVEQVDSYQQEINKSMGL